MKPLPGQPTNPRAERRRAEQRLLLLIMVTFVCIGGGLVAIIYDLTALATALPCLLGASGAIILIYAGLTRLERWRERHDG